MGKISPSDKMRMQALHELVYDTEESFENVLINILSIYCNTADWFDLCLLFLQLRKQNFIWKRG